MSKYIPYVYGLLFIGLTVFSYLFIDVNFPHLKSLFTGFSFNQRTLAASIYFLFTISLFSCFIYLLNRKTAYEQFFKMILPLIIIISLFSYPAILSFDIFNYLTTAKVAFHYLENPYIVMPMEFAGDPVLEFTRAANKVALYGPAWVVLTAAPFALSLGSYLASIILLKLLLVPFFVGSIILIRKMTKDNYPAFYFAANPLVLIETFVSGHNDIVMVFLALLSFYFLRRNNKTRAIIFLALSIMIKFATIFLIPVFIYLTIKMRKKSDINWDKVYIFAALCMFVIFALSPLREEMYPWYAIWFIPFVAMCKNKFLQYLVIAFSLGLLLRYIPYMATWDYFGMTPFIRIVLTILPVFLFFTYTLISRKGRLFFK